MIAPPPDGFRVANELLEVTGVVQVLNYDGITGSWRLVFLLLPFAAFGLGLI